MSFGAWADERLGGSPRLSRDRSFEVILKFNRINAENIGQGKKRYIHRRGASRSMQLALSFSLSEFLATHQLTFAAANGCLATFYPGTNPADKNWHSPR